MLAQFPMSHHSMEPSVYWLPKSTIPDFTGSKRDFGTWSWHWTIFWTRMFSWVRNINIMSSLNTLNCLKLRWLLSLAIIIQNLILLQFYSVVSPMALSKIAAIPTSPEIKFGVSQGFQSFSLWVHFLVSMLVSLEGPTGYELNCLFSCWPFTEQTAHMLEFHGVFTLTRQSRCSYTELKSKGQMVIIESSAAKALKPTCPTLSAQVAKQQATQNHQD